MKLALHSISTLKLFSFSIESTDKEAKLRQSNLAKAASNAPHTLHAMGYCGQQTALKPEYNFNNRYNTVI